MSFSSAKLAVVLILLSCGAFGCTHAALDAKEIAMARALPPEELLRVVRETPGMDRAKLIGQRGDGPVVVQYESEPVREDSLSGGSFSGRFVGTVKQHNDPPRIVYLGQVRTASPFPPYGGWLAEGFYYGQRIAERCARAAREPPTGAASP